MTFMIPFRQSNDPFWPELADALFVAVQGLGNFAIRLERVVPPDSPRLVGSPGGVAEANLVIVVDTELDPHEFDELFGEKIAAVVDRAASPSLRWTLLYCHEHRELPLADRNGPPRGLLKPQRSTRYDRQRR